MGLSFRAICASSAPLDAFSSPFGLWMRTTAKNDPQFRTSLGRVVVRSSGWVEALLVCACAFF